MVNFDTQMFEDINIWANYNIDMEYYLLDNIVGGPVSFAQVYADRGFDISGACSGSGCAATLTGSMSGVFVGPSAEGMAGTFGASDGSGLAISGGGLLKRP